MRYAWDGWRSGWFIIGIGIYDTEMIDPQHPSYEYAQEVASRLIVVLAIHFAKTVIKQGSIFVLVLPANLTQSSYAE
jgi:hypothetical protein